MSARRHSPAQIVLLLRRADEMLGRGGRIEAVAAELGVSAATFHRWRAQYGGIKAGDARRLAELDAENRRLRATVANQTLDIVMLRELLRTLTAGHTPRVALVQTLATRFDMSQRRACDVIGEPRTTVRRALTAVAGPTGHDRRHQAAGLAGEHPDVTEIFSAETVFADVDTREGALG